VFCRIVGGLAPASVVFEDRGTIAFMDIRPWTPGHLLVVPKVHAGGLEELAVDAGAAMMRSAMKAAAALRVSELRTEGINFILSDGRAAGQEVFHVHLHVVPRFAGDGFGVRISHDPAPPREVLDDQAGRIAAAWER
jgi:diadenosine tetraphosphate (Ap4A) HIT family hydrolase